MQRLSLLHDHIIANKTAVDSEPLTIVEKRKDGVAVLYLNRPTKLNSISLELIKSVNVQLADLETDDSVNVIVITGNGEKAFSAGADITSFKGTDFSKMLYDDYFETEYFQRLQTIRKPLIAAIHGFCFGGGFELALMCDILLASNQAKFGFPEIKLGVMPGAGGTQRILREVGRSKAMEMVLTGDPIDAKTAKEYRIVSRLYENQEKLLEGALELAAKIATFSRPSVSLAKKSLKASENMSYKVGLDYERMLFTTLFALEDKNEGVAAFLEKRKPNFKHR